MELTLLRSFGRKANLKALIFQQDHLNTHEAIQKISDILERQYGNVFGPSLLRDLQSTSTDRLPSQAATFDPKNAQLLNTKLYSALICYFDQRHPGRYHGWLTDPLLSSARTNPIPQHAVMLSEYAARGVKFTTFKKSLGDGQILFRDGSGCQKSGRINDIFMHARSDEQGVRQIQCFFSVTEFAPLEPNYQKVDPYRHYTLLGCLLSYNSPSLHLIIISLDDIIGHVCSCTLPGSVIGLNKEIELIVVVPIDFVSQFHRLFRSKRKANNLSGRRQWWRV